MDIFKYFDTYSLRARVFPALIAGLPSLALLAVTVPWDHLGLPQAIAILMAVVLLFAFSDLARAKGKGVEKKLETHSSIEQWYRNETTLPNALKSRYRKYIANKIKTEIPTEEDEINNTELAKDFYLSANAWLRDKTRDVSKYNILFAENITYGFRRNLLGLKYLALLLNFSVFLFCVVVFSRNIPYLSNIAYFDNKLVTVLLVTILHSLYMIFFVNKNMVRQASLTYGRQLILSCEKLIDDEN